MFWETKYYNGEQIVRRKNILIFRSLIGFKYRNRLISFILTGHGCCVITHLQWEWISLHCKHLLLKKQERLILLIYVKYKETSFKCISSTWILHIKTYLTDRCLRKSGDIFILESLSFLFYTDTKVQNNVLATFL